MDRFFEIVPANKLELNLQPDYQIALRNFYITLMGLLGYEINDMDNYKWTWTNHQDGWHFSGLPLCFPTNNTYLPVQIQCWIDDGHDDAVLLPSYPYRSEEIVNILGCAMDQRRFIELTTLWKLPAKELPYVYYLKSRPMRFHPINWAIGDSRILQEESLDSTHNPLKTAEDILQATETVKLWRPN